MKYCKITLALVLIIMCSSCATLLSGEGNTIYFSSSPENAKIFVNGEHVGSTNQDIRLKNRMKKKEVEIVKEGYETERIELETSFDKVSLLNIIGLYGFIVDWAAGSLVKYDSVYYDIDLKPTITASDSLNVNNLSLAK